MRVSVITATYNSAATLKETMDSVQAQDYPDIEYIVIDGNSSDGTQDLVRSYGQAVQHFVSERDRGIYDALNKGIALATGDIIALLHSDDVFDHPSVISRVVDMFRESKAEMLCTDVQICDPEDMHRVRRYYSCTRWKPWMFRIGHQPPHPGCFVRRELYLKYGNFDLSYRISADFDLLLRFILKHKLHVEYRKFVSVRMRDGGTSNAGFKARMEANREDHLSLRKNGYFSFLPFIYLKYLLKAFQWLNKQKA